ncbi:MAG TPA: hypothetical protein DCE78_10170, partial [Bacteroidetes bacterium]|nr:hypothetical protein [Bacteroidota bacterium]
MATRKERHQSKTGKKSSLPLFGIVGVVVAVIAVGAWYFAKPSTDESPTVGSISETAEIQGDWGMGNPDAKLTIIEYGDFQCPACGFYHPIVKELMEEFNDDVYFI